MLMNIEYNKHRRFSHWTNGNLNRMMAKDITDITLYINEQKIQKRSRDRQREGEREREGKEKCFPSNIVHLLPVKVFHCYLNEAAKRIRAQVVLPFRKS